MSLLSQSPTGAEGATLIRSLCGVAKVRRAGKPAAEMQEDKETGYKSEEQKKEEDGEAWSSGDVWE